jgi:hypothetical protein
MSASAPKVQAPPRLLVEGNRGSGLELPAVAVSGLLIADGPRAVSSKGSAGPCGGAEGGDRAPRE